MAFVVAVAVAAVVVVVVVFLVGFVSLSNLDRPSPECPATSPALPE